MFGEETNTVRSLKRLDRVCLFTIENKNGANRFYRFTSKIVCYIMSPTHLAFSNPQWPFCKKVWLFQTPLMESSSCIIRR